MMKHLVFFLICFVQITFSQSINKEDVGFLQEDDYTLKYLIGNTKIRAVITDFQQKDSLELKQFLKKHNFGNFQTNPALKVPHLFVTRTDVIAKDLYQNNISYFLCPEDFPYIELTFSRIERTPNTKLDGSIIPKLLRGELVDEKQPKDMFTFAGAKMRMQSNWQWIDVNRLSDNYTGEQMNWSIFPTLAEAEESNRMQLQRAEIEFQNPPEGSAARVISDTKEQLFFENVPTEARKLVYHITNTNFEPKEVKYIVYFISQQVRNKNIACVLSFYEIDGYDENNLPPMLSLFIRK